MPRQATREVSIVFSKPRGWFKPLSWFIRALERTPYSHVSLAWNADRLGVRAVYQAAASGVNFSSYFHFRQDNITVQSFRIRLTEAQYYAMLRLCMNLSGKKYGIKQLLGILLVRLFRLKANPLARGQRTFVCSELVFYMLTHIYRLKSDLDPDLVGPKDINNLLQGLVNERLHPKTS